MKSTTKFPMKKPVSCFKSQKVVMSKDDIDEIDGVEGMEEDEF